MKIASYVTSAHPQLGAAIANPYSPQIDSVKSLEVKYDAARRELVFPNPSIPTPVHAGEWVVVRIPGGSAVHHRIENASLYPTVKVSENGVTQPSSFQAMAVLAANPGMVPATPATTPPPPSKSTLISGLCFFSFPSNYLLHHLASYLTVA